MKKQLLLFLYTVIVSLILSSCMEECREARTITRPLFTADELKWINVADSMPRFRVSLLDTAGRVSKVLDTITGRYSSSITKEYSLGASECDNIYYQKAVNRLSLEYNGLNFTQVFEMDNYRNDTIFDARLGVRVSAYFTSKTTLDTALVGNKVYQEVYKLPSSASSLTTYYAKGVGYILLKRTYYFELLP